MVQCLRLSATTRSMSSCLPPVLMIPDDVLSPLSDSDTDVDDYKTGRRLTRQEKKQVEKESEEYIGQFTQSA